MTYIPAWKSAGVPSSLRYNRDFLNHAQGHKSPFHFREETAIHAFRARVTAVFYQHLPNEVQCQFQDQVDGYISQLGEESFLEL